MRTHTRNSPLKNTFGNNACLPEHNTQGLLHQSARWRRTLQHPLQRHRSPLDFYRSGHRVDRHLRPQSRANNQDRLQKHSCSRRGTELSRPLPWLRGPYTPSEHFKLIDLFLVLKKYPRELKQFIFSCLLRNVTPLPHCFLPSISLVRV